MVKPMSGADDNVMAREPQSMGQSTALPPGDRADSVTTTSKPSGRLARSLILARRPYTLLMMILLAIIIFIAVFGPLLAPYNPLMPDPLHEFAPPSGAHVFGTDEVGHDIFSRVLAGAHYSLEIVVVVLSLAVAIGVTVGALAGYFGGLVDEILMRITEVFLAFPTLILAMAVTATLGPSLLNVMLSLGLVSWPGYARLLRAQILSVKNFTFVEAAHSVGVSPLRILYRHVLPNAITPLVAQVSLDMAGTLLVATGLGFLGMGAQPPTPEWGLMVSSGMAYTLSAWWDPAFAGMAIFLTALCLNALGEYLRDVFAPETTT